MLEEAELVALWVGKDMPSLFAHLTNLGRAGTQRQQAVKLCALVAIYRVHIKVQTQGCCLLPGHSREDDGRSRAAEARFRADLYVTILAMSPSSRPSSTYPSTSHQKRDNASGSWQFNTSSSKATAHVSNVDRGH